MFLSIADFDKKYVTSIAKIASSPKKILPLNIHLPSNTCIHFIADTDVVMGIDSSYCLLRNCSSSLYIYHVLNLIPAIGSVTSAHFAVSNAIRRYQKTHLNIRPISNLDRSLSTNTAPIVLNYALLSKMNKYSKNTLMVYQEWFNIRATMWDMINQIGSRREHFIRYQLPDILPTKIDLQHYAQSFKSGGLSEFHSNDTFDLLELWRMLSPDVESPDMAITENAIEHINLVFVEAGVLVIIKLQELLAWAAEDHTQAMNAFYRFLDSLVELRTPIEVTADEETTEPSVSNTTIETLIKEQGSIGALSSAEQRGLVNLSQRYKTIPDPHKTGVTIDKLVVTPDDLKVDNTALLNDSPTIHDKSMLQSSLQDLDKKYVKDVLHKDIMQTVLMLQPAGVIVKDINVKQKNTAVTKADTYSVQLQPINSAPSTINFTIPVINSDGTFLAGGVKYRMDKQKGEMPIVKNKSNMVALTSYYGKIFVTRNESSVANFSKWILKEIFVRATNLEDKSVTDLIYGINKITNIKVPRVYSAVSEAIDSFVAGDYFLTFSYNKIPTIFKEAEIAQLKSHELIPCGYQMFTHFPLGMDSDGIIHLVNTANVQMANAGTTEVLGSLPYLIDPNMGEGPVEYTEMSILNRRIPIILALTYMYGLDKTLEKLGISFTLSPTNVRLPVVATEYKLKFKDIVYVINVANKYHRLLIGGFSSIGKDISKYKGSDFNKQTIYNYLLSGLGLTNYHLRELKLMWDMYIEPITLGLLTEMGEPTTFYGLLLRANDLLIDDHIPEYNSSRYKGYERLAGMVYHQLINAMRAHRSQGSMSNIGITMNPNSVWLDIVQDQSMSLVEESNPIHNLKEHEAFTHSGAGGRNTVTMVKDTRGFTQHDLGVVSESTPDSAKVGIRAYLTPDPNIVSVRGTTRAYDEKIDGPVKVLSTSALISPAVTHDDGKRVNFISVQHSHGVACPGYKPLPYRTGYEEVIGARVDDLFVVTAEDDGIVTEVKADSLGVTYGSDKLRRYELGIAHGTVAGNTIPHKRITDMVVGQKFKKGDALIYNSGFFTRSELNPANVVYKAGAIKRVALLENSDTVEDGCVISEKLADDLSTAGTTLHGIIADFNMVIHNLVKIGDKVDPETILCTLENFISEDLKAKDAAAIKALTRLAGNNPKAKVYGTITDIEVLYFGKIEDMNFSLQEIVNTYDNARARHAKRFMTDAVKTGKIDEPIRIAGKQMVANQIAIKIYIDGEIKMGVGDKLVFGNALKCTCSSVATQPITSKDGMEVDALFGYQSIADRIVCSPEISGLMNTIMCELSKQMGQRFKK